MLSNYFNEEPNHRFVVSNVSNVVFDAQFVAAVFVSEYTVICLFVV